MSNESKNKTYPAKTAVVAKNTSGLSMTSGQRRTVRKAVKSRNAA